MCKSATARAAFQDLWRLVSPNTGSVLHVHIARDRYLVKVETTDTGSVLQEFSASPGAAFPRLLLLLGSGERVTGCDSGLEVPAVTQRAVEIKIMRMRALTLARYGSSWAAALAVPQNGWSEEIKSPRITAACRGNICVGRVHPPRTVFFFLSCFGNGVWLDANLDADLRCSRAAGLQ